MRFVDVDIMNLPGAPRACFLGPSYPLPPALSPSSSSSSQSAKQRRVSLALPSSPRVFPAWSFRDDTGLGVHSADADADAADGDEEKKGKMRKIAQDSMSSMADGQPGSSAQGAQLSTLPLSDKPEKKPRKKWTMEETQMLVAGCNKVRTRSLLRE